MLQASIPIFPTRSSDRLDDETRSQPEFDKSSQEPVRICLHFRSARPSCRIVAHPCATRTGTLSFEENFGSGGSQRLGSGAGLRISGGRPVDKYPAARSGVHSPTRFQVGGNREIEFICELRAAEAWFDAEKLQVMRID
jgi:hypothetical protein